MKILVTGSGGFVGKRLVKKLQDCGYNPVGFDILEGDDILDEDAVHAAIKDVDAVYHTAAQADLTKICDHQSAKVCNDINILGTYNVAHACAVHNKPIIYASTCCVYGNAKDRFGIDHEDYTVPTPRELYAATKLAGENIIRGYAQTLSLPFIILRYGTIYGPGMREALAVHIFLDRALRGEDIIIHGTGEQERTQTHVDDIVEASIKALESPSALGHIINVCGAEKISVLQMAKDIIALTNSSSRIVHGPDRPWQTFYENVSLEKARHLLNWQPRISWEDGLKKTAQWMKKKHNQTAVSLKPRNRGLRLQTSSRR